MNSSFPIIHKHLQVIVSLSMLFVTFFDFNFQFVFLSAQCHFISRMDVFCGYGGGGGYTP